MKKLIAVLVMIAILLVLFIAGVLGYLWYLRNHLFVEDAVYPLNAMSLDLREQDISIGHYNAVREGLPNCEILWNVPFQDGKYSSDTTALTVTELSDGDIARMDYFPWLKTVDASGCSDYGQIEKLMAHRPECKVTYMVDLGGITVEPDIQGMILENGEYDFDILMENLSYLHKLEAITLRMPELSQEQIAQLEEAYENIAFTCTVELLGAEYTKDTTELDLSHLTSEELEEVLEKLPLLPNVTSLKLMDESGSSSLTLEDVRKLMAAVPDALGTYTFDFYGQTLSLEQEEVHIKNQKIGEAGVEQVRAVLDVLTNCKRFVLENCQISNETMAKLREDYRDRTKIVWRVSFGKGSTMTDAEVIRAVYDLVDDNCGNLIYCEDVKYMDLGHNEWLDGCDFVAGMPNLEYLIISGAPIRSLEPFRNCKNLKFLEIAFCGYISDLSPLADCTNLQMLNIGNTKVVDLSPLDGLNMTHLMARNYPGGKCPIPQEERDRFVEQHPDCWSSFTGPQPYGTGWRYEEDNKTYLDDYLLLRTVFRYDLDPNIPNHVGWYLKDEETTYKNKQ